ncbi:enolase C-terminal domain-like protein [Metabacillus halosaccharovorans]|uniref:enolase C-terminal domain-like protein n=1 Tax=Metabacillus halosaccharovorans TaxID=930124 RepID=UPI000994E0ED|nr:enolase C-terminal domain-like protein [Metabacillus halosaccharovorans]
MDMSNIANKEVERLEWCKLPGKRIRAAGCNARLGVHGDSVPLDLVRVTIGGQEAFGWSRINEQRAQELLGKKVGELFNNRGDVSPLHYDIEFPLLDWLGKIKNKPVYKLLLGDTDLKISVPCYDTSLYFDDLHLEDDDDAVKLIQSQALEGKARGHRAYKIKVGRGAMHMPLDKGTERDIAIINGVREAVGPEAKIMIDANNGYNLNLIKYVLKATAHSNITWIEEAFHEDPPLLENLKNWIQSEGLNVLVTDGEGDSAAQIVDWAKQGYLDAIQYDILHYGFHKWKNLGQELDKVNVYTAPHSYGCVYGNYVLGHLAPLIKGFLFIEWDEINVEGIDGSNYIINEGKVEVPDKPGFGIELDHHFYSKMVEKSGWKVCKKLVR